MQFIPMLAYLRAYISLIFLMLIEYFCNSCLLIVISMELQERMRFELDRYYLYVLIMRL